MIANEHATCPLCSAYLTGKDYNVCAVTSGPHDDPYMYDRVHCPRCGGWFTNYERPMIYDGDEGTFTPVERPATHDEQRDAGQLELPID